MFQWFFVTVLGSACVLSVLAARLQEDSKTPVGPIIIGNAILNPLRAAYYVANLMDLPDAVREASIGRVRPKLMTAGTAMLGLLPMLVLNLHGTEIERPLAVVMIGGLATSTLFTLLVLPTFYLQVHGWLERRSALATER